MGLGCVCICFKNFRYITKILPTVISAVFIKVEVVQKQTQKQQVRYFQPSLIGYAVLSFSGRRGWTKLLRTAILAFCLATCMRLLLSGTTIEYYITPARIRSTHAGQGHGQKPHNFIQVQGHKSHNLLEAPLGGSSKIEYKVNSPEDEENKNEANGDLNDAAVLRVAHENENAGEKSDHENLLEDDGANEYDVECPYKDSKLERLKCFLPAQMTEKGGPFDLYLEQRANKDKVIFLISIDSGYVEMGLNLHETSFKRLRITNYLYVCSDTESAHELESHGIDCFIYEQNIRHDKASRYMSKDFVRKTHVKTKIILAALYLGYNVFITDADIVYFKNPLDHLNCPTCDIEIQSDHVEENSGFYLSRPTEGAILLHQKMMDKANQSNKTSNQKALNRALKNLKQDDLIKVGHAWTNTSFHVGFIILNVSTGCGQETILVLIASLSTIIGSWGNKPKCTDSRSTCCGQWIQMVTIVIQTGNIYLTTILLTGEKAHVTLKLPH